MTVLDVAGRRLTQLSAVNVVTALNCIAKCADGRAALGDERLAALVARAAGKESCKADVDPRGIANLAWSLAALPCSNDPLMDSIASSSISR
eukprot:CAMPEP_0197929496 /NCGR_PEP_ID=MMETSP1439-20131203/103898_1 /TAXON_ID=66791 /ORGANISM="Gonyaulax spinifera, Strain CCMP409" /LENGTH=91 /DNA_ID=CAMNT_0043552143 /DNA_START=141 /DNA_END=417 /DNA_ORIENTATION=-